MIFIPEDWIKHIENEDAIRDLLDVDTDIVTEKDNTYKELVKMDEPILAEKYKKGLLASPV